jgi:uncharacterized protein
MYPYLAALFGGACIGLAAFLLLVTTGRVAGVSGIAAGLVVPAPARGDVGWRLAFVGGLVVGGVVLSRFLPVGPVATSTPPAVLAAAGLLVGFGTRLGGGCTSGHGVCGVADLRRRSIVATAVFMATGIATVAVVRHLVGA